MLTLTRRFISSRIHALVLLVALALAAQGTVATGVNAQSETELRSSADYAYGQVMRFRLQAQNLGDLRGVTLYFRPHTSAESYTVEIPIDQGSDVDVSYALDLTQTRLPPFSTVSYWWELERQDGATFRVPERVISYVDDQFSWQWLSKADPEGGGIVTVQWTGDNPVVGETAFAIVLEALDRISPYVPLEEVRPFNVFIYPSSADLGSAMRLAGAEWEVGQSHPELGVLVVTAVNPATSEGELREGIGRELTDQMLYQALPEGYVLIPQWLRSGLAEIAAGGPSARSQILLAEAVAGNSTLSLAELCASYPQTEAEQALAATQSGAYLTAIADKYGPEAVVNLLTAFAQGASCDDAFSGALQATADEITTDWRAQFEAPNSQRTLISQAIIWVLMILVGFGLAALLVRRVGNSREQP